MSLCKGCEKDLPILPEHCKQCGQFLTVLSEKCGHCLTHPPAFDALFTLFPYEKPITALVAQLKFGGELAVARLFGERISSKVLKWYEHTTLPDLILPVPLYRDRLSTRGFNQAIEIARPLASPLEWHTVKRVKNTLAQSGLNARERAENMKKAFISLRRFDGLHIAILDDVVTTGNTVNTLATVLKEQGAKRVDVWCVARRG